MPSYHCKELLIFAYISTRPQCFIQTSVWQTMRVGNHDKRSLRRHSHVELKTPSQVYPHRYTSILPKRTSLSNDFVSIRTKLRKRHRLTLQCSNILFLPFRHTHAVSMAGAIKQYISTKYDQHPDMFTKDLEAVDKLRAEAVNSLDTHISGIKRLTAYAAQLVWMGGKFPIDVSRSLPGLYSKKTLNLGL